MRIWSHHSFWIMQPLGFPCVSPSILWYCQLLTQEARPSKVDDRFKDPLTALEQWPGQGSRKFWAWSKTEYYCLISHLWWRHSGKKIQIDIPSGIAVAWNLMIFRDQKASCKVVRRTMWSGGCYSLWNAWKKNKKLSGECEIVPFKFAHLPKWVIKSPMVYV